MNDSTDEASTDETVRLGEIVGASVKNAGKNIEVNSIDTAFGVLCTVQYIENVVCPKTKKDIQSVLTRHNSGRYSVSSLEMAKGFGRFLVGLIPTNIPNPLQRPVRHHSSHLKSIGRKREVSIRESRTVATPGTPRT